MKTVITYGTFDLLHYGHMALLQRASYEAGTGKMLDVFSEIYRRDRELYSA